MASEPFPKATMDDERNRMLGDAWQHAAVSSGAWTETASSEVKNHATKIHATDEHVLTRHRASHVLF
jgi:hypothetical protein